MNMLVEQLESLFHDKYKTKGWQNVQEPLWSTWSLEKFGAYHATSFCRSFPDLTLAATSVPDILTVYHRSLQMHVDIVNTLRSHSVSFEVSREAISRWVAQPFLEEGSWDAQWEDLCEVEIERWSSTR